jgi:hypothetical protein
MAAIDFVYAVQTGAGLEPIFKNLVSVCFFWLPRLDITINTYGCGCARAQRYPRFGTPLFRARALIKFFIESYARESMGIKIIDKSTRCGCGVLVCAPFR